MNSQQLKSLLLSTLMICVAAFSALAQSKYEGLKYETNNLPEGLENIGAWLVADTYEGLMDTRFAVKELKPAGSDSFQPTMLWFEKTIKYLAPDRSRALVEVVDVLELPEILDGTEFVNSDCSVNGKRDPQIFGIAVMKDQEFLSDFVHVWNANVRTERFEEISPKWVRCENVGYGV